jgi:hypothetical protein
MAQLAESHATAVASRPPPHRPGRHHPLTTPSELDLVSARVGSYQLSFQFGVHLEQLSFN